MKSMDRTFRITPGLESKIVNRSLKRIGIILTCMLPFFVLVFSAKAHTIYDVIAPLGMTCALFTLLFFFGRQYGISINKKILFHVTDRYIGKSIDADMSFLSPLSIDHGQIVLSESDVEKLKKVIILWGEIEYIKDKGHSLLIKSKGADTWKGIGMLMLPKEIENFDELEKIIHTKTVEYGLEFT